MTIINYPSATPSYVSKLSKWIITNRKQYVTARKLAARAAQQGKLKAWAHYNNAALKIDKELKKAEKAISSFGVCF